MKLLAQSDNYVSLDQQLLAVVGRAIEARHCVEHFVVEPWPGDNIRKLGPRLNSGASSATAQGSASQRGCRPGERIGSIVF